MAKSQHISIHQDKLLRATTMRKASRYLAKRSAEIKECRTEGKDYSGNTVWRISQMQKKWYRTAQQRAKLETRPETRRLVESSRKFGRMRKPDERLANEEHMKAYRRNGQGWKPPAPKPAFHRRRYRDRPACSKRRRQRKKVSQRLNPLTANLWRSRRDHFPYNHNMRRIFIFPLLLHSHVPSIPHRHPASDDDSEVERMRPYTPLPKRLANSSRNGIYAIPEFLTTCR